MSPYSRARAGRSLWLIATAIVTAGWLTATAARELAVEIDEMVEVEIATIGLAEGSGAPVVLLREPAAREVIPIAIGTAEARAIMSALQGVQYPRPMTHDLLNDVLGAMDARLERVFVDDLVDNVYLGMLELHVEGREERVRVDSRPSDAIALAVRTGATIHVAPKVLEAAQELDYEGLEDDQVVNAIGITVMAPNDDLRDALALPDRPGVLVSGATGPAADAGMRPGALIVEVNGETPESPMEFLELVRATSADEDARIVYWQDGEMHAIDVSTDVPEPERGARDPGSGVPL